MSTGTCSIEKRRLAAWLRCQLRTLDRCSGRDSQQRSSPPPHRIGNIHSGGRALVHACTLLYFSSCKLAASSQGFFEGLICAQDLGLRLTLEEGLS